MVHTSYGIGKFINISTSPDSGDEEMNILYRDNTILHVPLSQAHLVSRYIGLGSKTPELNKLGDSKWQRAKKSAERSVADYAAQLLNVQAERQTGKGYSHPRTANGCGSLKAPSPSGRPRTSSAPSPRRRRTWKPPAPWTA